MKKIILGFLIFQIFNLKLSNAQTQRLVLWEQFTQASCGPCASVNPTIQNLLNSNPNKVIGLKYQVSWPGYDPMNLQNPTEVATRVNYYGVSSVPYSVLDGDVQGNNPPVISVVNSYYAQSAPIKINLSHSFSNNFDSIKVHMQIIGTGIASGNFRAHIAVVEKHIHFSTPPGSNGEKDFYNVMKKMLPNDQGTIINNTINVDDTIDIFQKWKYQNVYDKNELSVIAFVQNQTTKEVLQAAYSAPVPFTPFYNLEMCPTNIKSKTEKICENKITPIVKIQNNGSDTITKVKIKYSVNDELPLDYIWTGKLGFFQSDTIELPEILFTNLQDQNELKVITYEPNDSIEDGYPLNDTLLIYIEKADTLPPFVKIMIRTDINANQLSWNIINSNDSIIFESPAYTGGVQTKTYSLILPPNCYTLNLFDSGGNGFATGAFLRIFNNVNNQVFFVENGNNEGSFGFEKSVAFNTIASTPSISFNPTNQAQNIALNQNITITASEALRIINDSSINNLNLPSIIKLYKDSIYGQNIDFTANIDGTKKIISIDPISDFEENKTYFLLIKDTLEGNFDNTVPSQFISFSTLIISNLFESENFPDMISLTPNPAKDFLYINSNHFIEILSATIYNNFGKQIAAVGLGNSSNVINIADFSSGLYCIHLKTKHGSITQKFIKY